VRYTSAVVSEDLHVERDGARAVIPGADLRWVAVRSAGPGGQNVNKVATKVELRFDLPGTRALSAEQKARLRQLARRRLDADGFVVVTSQRTRNRLQNLADARRKLADLVAEALVPPAPRVATRPSRAAVRRRMEDKRRRAERKRGRRPVRGEG
jgi:ribosome-associated protein